MTPKFARAIFTRPPESQVEVISEKKRKAFLDTRVGFGNTKNVPQKSTFGKVQFSERIMARGRNSTRCHVATTAASCRFSPGLYPQPAAAAHTF